LQRGFLGRIWDNRVGNWKGDTVRGEIIREGETEKRQILSTRGCLLSNYTGIV